MFVRRLLVKEHDAVSQQLRKALMARVAVYATDLIAEAISASARRFSPGRSCCWPRCRNAMSPSGLLSQGIEQVVNLGLAGIFELAVILVHIKSRSLNSIDDTRLMKLD
jgi:hypothetical protein